METDSGMEKKKVGGTVPSWEIEVSEALKGGVIRKHPQKGEEKTAVSYGIYISQPRSLSSSLS